MQAIGVTQYLPLNDVKSFVLFDAPVPEIGAHDLLIEVEATSINPVDMFTRRRVKSSLTTPKILGWDGVGIVRAIGSDVTLFEVGQRVFWAGDYTRSGSDARLQAVDERIVGLAPDNFSAAEIAALPLTALTAWEALFEKLPLQPTDNHGESVLIMNGAGGVGSVAIQLAKRAGLQVIATASRPETIQWVQDLGADIVINHHEDLAKQLAQHDIKTVNHVLYFANMTSTWSQITKLIAPRGHIVSITGGKIELDTAILKEKAVSFDWEWMFSKAKYQTDNLISQHHILTEVARLMANGELKSTLTTTLSGFTTENFRRAHELIETNQTIGKIVITY
ncbi:MAG TPA: zinc-binding alcohol dehydrogenase family protein [Lactobacillaceae bacterium]|jgi:zinc-binding alcohol dehydrogenase family protein